uniref:Transcription factor Iwr1 domain-containing protein n=1 Tax=Kalanchoe fedtschenkoi TaxID=63787 RepID=A0A7N0TGS9_KALFE
MYGLTCMFLGLEISERPVKRPLVDFEKLSVSKPPADGVEISEKLPVLDFGKLSFSDASLNGQPKKKTVFVQHVETVTSSEAADDILKSLLQSYSNSPSQQRTKIRRDRNILEGETKQDRLLAKAKHEQELVAKNARFEQIWRSRKGKKELMQEEPLREACHLYDIERVDVQEISKDVHESSDASLEEYMILQNYLPLMDRFLPSAAEELRSGMQSYASSIGSKVEYVYDLYTVNADVAMDDNETMHPFPLVQVDEDDTFYDGPDETEYDSEDSNAEDNPLNDYPDEEPSENEELESESEKSDENDSDKSSTESLKPEDLLYFGNGRQMHIEEGDIIADYDDSIEGDD